MQFDGCLGPTADQDQVMERLKVVKMLDSVLEGYSSTIMACGQTGSGKTYTMSGRDEVNFIIYMSFVQHLIPVYHQNMYLEVRRYLDIHLQLSKI